MKALKPHSFRLFTSVDEAVWQIGTIPLFRALFDNYDAVQRINAKAQTLLKNSSTFQIKLDRIDSTSWLIFQSSM